MRHPRPFATPPRRGAPRAGFSLPELLVVLVVVGILVLLARPAINLARAQGNAAVSGLATTLQAAQREAVARQHDVLVGFDVPNRRLQLVFDANENGALDAGERVKNVPLDGALVFARPATVAARAFGGQAVAFPAGATGLPTLVFHRSGSANFAGGFYLTSSPAAAGDARRAADTRAVEVIRATGRVEWWRWTGSTWQRGS